MPSDVIADAILSRINAGSPSASMSCTLCGPSPQCTVTALGASTPRLRGYHSHGHASRFSATQYVYFAGLALGRRVHRSPAAPATCSIISRTARPTVALARSSTATATGDGCPSAALLEEIGRGTDATKMAYTDGVLAMADDVRRARRHDPQSVRLTVLGVFAMVIGILQLSRVSHRRTACRRGSSKRPSRTPSPRWSSNSRSAALHVRDASESVILDNYDVVLHT